MAYETIIQVLKDNGETEPEIDHAFVIKIGCFSFRSSEEVTAMPRTGTSMAQGWVRVEEKAKGTVPDLESTIIEALGKHPNVFDIATLHETRLRTTRQVHEDTIFSGNVFSLRIRLPERLQKHRALWLDKEPPPEEFQVVSLGSIFAAFAPTKEYPVWTNFGQEYRELFKEQVDKETKLKCRPVPPCPMHPEIYVVLRKKRNQDGDNGTRIISGPDDLIFVTNPGSQSDAALVAQLLQDTFPSLFKFYGLALSGLFLHEYQVEILDHFAELSSAMKDLSAAHWWSLVTAANLARRGKKELSQVYTLLVQHGVEQLGQDRSRTEFVKGIDDDRVLSHLGGYFSKITESKTEVPQLLQTALKYFETELQTFGSIRSIVVASLLGAGVGALLTVLLTHIFRM